MISNQEEDEFVAVRVQDPRMQNEGSWNSYVDFKIFLHTNSKAFTAKTSCVRRRYSEFVWLKKKLQKNAGLVPVPDLPGKSFFSFSNEDFLERRRKGLQVFLDNVVNMTVCLSDSQLHLFLQTQLPVGHIQDCVQGHTPYSVTDAILTYASSNRGFAQAQEDDPIKEPSLTVSYESMESPAPHQPCLQPQELFNPELLSRGASDPPEELCDKDTVEFQHKENSSVKVLQKDNHLEAVVEDRGATGVTFFLGDSQDVPESLSLGEETQQRSCQIQTPVEVHSPMGTGFEENRVDSLSEEERSVREENVKTSDTEEETAPQVDQVESSGEAKMEKVEKCVHSAAILDFQDSDIKEEGTESNTRSQEDVLEVVCSENQVLESHIISEVNALEHVDSTEVHANDVSCSEELKDTDGQKEAKMEKVDFETEKCVNSAAILDFQEQGTESDTRSQEDVLEVICSENQVLENHIISEVNALEQVDSTEVHGDDVSCSEEIKDTTMEKVDFEAEKCVDSAAILDFKEQGTEIDAVPQEDSLEVFYSEKRILENHIISEVKCLEHVDSTEVHVEDVSCSEEFKDTTLEKVDFEPEECVDSASILDFKDNDIKEQGTETCAGPQEDSLEVICSENQVLENHVISEVNVVEHVEVHVEDINCSEEVDGQKEAEKSDESEVKEETTLESEIHEETHNVDNVPEVEGSSGDTAQQMDQVEQEVDLVETNDDCDEDSHSSSNESIVKVSDEESETEETEDSIPAANGYMKTSPEEVSLWSPVETSSRNIIDLHMNGCPVDKEDMSTQEDEDLHYITDISKSLDLNSTVTGADLTENSDFSIIESSCTPGLADSKCTEPETLSLLSLDASEETHEVEVH